MGMLGLHIALNDEELAALISLPESERADFVSETFEVQKFGTTECCETDKSWAYIHSALNGTDPDGPLEVGAGPSVGLLGRLLGRKTKPVDQSKFAIMGHGHVLMSEDYYIGLVGKDRVQGVMEALEAISIEELGAKVRTVHRKFSASGTADDAADYAMGWYGGVVAFYRDAASNRKNVIFTESF